MNSEIDGKSLDIKAQKLDMLQEIFPEFFSEGKLDLASIKEVLGDEELATQDHYELSWAGKAEARREIQRRTTATLIPDKEGSVNFDTSENIFIEGENLEVLRTLQKAYFGKVKMIYIDPPYNTGSDSFVYPDDYAERKEDYEKRSGRRNGEGYLNKLDLFRKNTKENGQYHSVWLSMLYPRLYLARNLMREDGVIFVSIDDNEATNLRLLMDEIFGSENFIATIVWEKGRKNDSSFFSDSVEYMLVFGKNVEHLSKLGVWREEKPGLEIILEKYNELCDAFKSNHEAIEREMIAFYNGLDRTEPAKKLSHFHRSDDRGLFFGADISSASTSIPDYEVIHPVTHKPVRKPSRGWGCTEPVMLERIKDERVLFGSDETTIPLKKSYLVEVDSIVKTPVIYKDGRSATMVLKDLLGKAVFENPKDHLVLADLFSYAETNNDYLALDFFAGSGTTAQAILHLNKQDGGRRKFILVQMPESTEEDSSARRAGYETVADICKDRIVKVLKQFSEGNNGKMEFAQDHQDLGFRGYKLYSSNFKHWKSEITDKDELLKQLEEFQEPLFAKPADSFDLLTELLIKSGVPLSAKTEMRSTEDGATFYVVEDRLIYALDNLTDQLLKDVEATKPTAFVTLGNLFTGEKADETMTNWKLQLEEAGIDFKLI